MKKQYIAFLFLFLLLLSGCSDPQPPMQQEVLKPVEQVGQIPDELIEIVENNLWKDVTAFDGRVLKSDILSSDQENRTVTHQIRMMDLYGKELAAYTCSSDDAYHVTTLTATAEGGFLFVFGFQDYAYGQNTWASDKGFASRVIKCDKDGNVQFDTALEDMEGRALEYCFEKNGQFYFFGTIQKYKTKNRGINPQTDIYMARLNENGELSNTQCIAGSDFDDLHFAERSGDHFVLSISAQSDDGDFTGSNSGGYPVKWVFTVDDDLEIIKKKRSPGRDFSDTQLGEKDGAPVYKSTPLLNDFDAGTPTAFIDYGDFFLIVSENNTGVYENTPPAVSSIWYYTETVYSGYDDSGKLLFRASVDSSPDYDNWINN
ncbi:MAG: hypothetical protein E7464_02215 [Ruminococcaceae bacterium]|nr:hypothetical protein [Oscillospiraceae bacterium]